jgi:hypothetical protein
VMCIRAAAAQGVAASLSVKSAGSRGPDRPQKVAFGEKCASGARGLLIYCSDYRCSHWIAISGVRWPDDVRLSNLEPRLTCRRYSVPGICDFRPNEPTEADIGLSRKEIHEARLYRWWVSSLASRHQR